MDSANFPRNPNLRSIPPKSLDFRKYHDRYDGTWNEIQRNVPPVEIVTSQRMYTSVTAPHDCSCALYCAATSLTVGATRARVAISSTIRKPGHRLREKLRKQASLPAELVTPRVPGSRAIWRKYKVCFEHDFLIIGVS